VYQSTGCFQTHFFIIAIEHPAAGGHDQSRTCNLSTIRVNVY
jgi:hypothetical protein